MRKTTYIIGSDADARRVAWTKGLNLDNREAVHVNSPRRVEGRKFFAGDRVLVPNPIVFQSHSYWNAWEAMERGLNIFNLTVTMVGPGDYEVVAREPKVR